MKRVHAATRILAPALFALIGLSAHPITSPAAEDAQELGRRDMEDRARAQAEALRSQEESIRRMEATQARLQANSLQLAQSTEQDLARRDMEDRARSQAEALRSQEQAIRRMEATQAEIEGNTQRMAQESAEQARANTYPYYPYVVPRTPVLPAPDTPVLRNGAPRDAVSGITFAPLSDRLKSYFGTQSGVLVVSAGADAPFGLQDGDVIISIDGRIPVSVEHAAGILRSYRPDEHVKLRVQRDRRTVDLDTSARARRNN